MFRGQVLKNEPASSATYGEVEIEYEVMPGWNEDISKAKSFEELPPNCKSFVLRIEELVGVPIKWIGVGAWWKR
jgi:adenylosuccinate synthase